MDAQVQNTESIPLLKESRAKETVETKDASDPKKAKEALALLREWVVFFIGLAYYCVCLFFALADVSFHSLFTLELYPTLPIGFLFATVLTIASHLWLRLPQQINEYGALTLVAFLARSVGSHPELVRNGVTPPFWAIVFGFCFTQVRRLPSLQPAKEFKPTVLPLNQEFFIKVGVLLLATDMTAIAELGGPGLAVAWVDTLSVLCVFTFIGTKIFKFAWRESIIIVGATCICGSSAATAIAVALGIPADAPIVQTILALMGVLNTPLIPTMPRLPARDHVVGAWIGGSIDSTGQVIACAAISGGEVLTTATIIKSAQNLLIIPISVVLTSINNWSNPIHTEAQHSSRCARLTDGTVYICSQIWQKFPRFILGFIITSAVSSVLPGDLKTRVIQNSFVLSEWISLLGFVLIGMELDLSAFQKMENIRLVLLYLLTQAVDIATTLGWSELVMP